MFGHHLYTRQVNQCSKICNKRDLHPVPVVSEGAWKCGSAASVKSLSSGDESICPVCTGVNTCEEPRRPEEVAISLLVVGDICTALRELLTSLKVRNVLSPPLSFKPETDTSSVWELETLLSVFELLLG